jgi:hypothetical protein
MSKKTIYRTKVSFTVLSDKPISQDMTLDSITAKVDDDEYLMYQGKIEKSTELLGKIAVNEIEKSGYECDFFNMDAEGNELEFENTFIDHFADYIKENM